MPIHAATILLAAAALRLRAADARPCILVQSLSKEPTGGNRMGIKRDFNFDLNPETNADLCRALCNGEGVQQFSTCPPDPVNFELEGEKDLPSLVVLTDAQTNTLQSVSCASYELEKFEVLDARGFRVTNIEILMPKFAKVELGAKARLFVAAGATQAQKNAILAAWGAYTPADDLDDLEDQLLQIGVPRRTYVVDLCAIYTVHNLRADRARRDLALADAAARGWRLESLGTQCSCKAPPLEMAPDDRRFDKVPSADDLEPKRPSACSDWPAEPVDVVKASFNGFPDFRIVMVAVVVEVNRCLRIVVNLPELQIRDVTTEVHAYVVAPVPTLEHTEKAIRKCIDDAAVSAAIVLLISGGVFPAAVVAFEVAMKACLAYVISDAVAECVKPGLYLKEVRSQWRPAT